jgi:UDP-3-O-[3-hydroxymyristoyl] N-acetylglucosamine deacetylase
VSNASDIHEHTLGGPAICAGVGLHTGRRVRMAIRPAPAGAGVTFVRTDVKNGDNRVPVSAEAVVATQLGTVIANSSDVRVSTIEHLMAAFAVLGIDNVTVELDGPEVPILDGSAQPFIELLDRAGFRRQEKPQQYIEVLETVVVHEGDKSAALMPCEQFEVFFEVEFPTPVIGRQSIDLVVTEESFRKELSAARTFGFVEEVEALRAKGLARGGSLENAVVIDGDRILNAEGLRFPDEFCRHKALDAIGDLYVLGMPMLGRFEGRKAGHGLNNAVVRALLARPSAWRVVTFEREMAEAV